MTAVDPRIALIAAAIEDTPKAVDARALALELFRTGPAEHVDAIAVSTAHGHTAGVGDVVKLVRGAFKDLTIIAGNVTSAAGVRSHGGGSSSIARVRLPVSDTTYGNP